VSHVCEVTRDGDDDVERVFAVRDEYWRMLLCRSAEMDTMEGSLSQICKEMRPLCPKFGSAARTVQGGRAAR
jgi:hypothetical protein